jgi:RNA polymerase sigma factor (sigma-70 family)
LIVLLTRAEIIQSLGKCDADVFAELYEEYLPKVYRYINYRIANQHQAEDLTSVIFEKALTKFQSYKSDKAKFSTWIFTIARNTLIDHYRVSSKQKTIILEEELKPAISESSPQDESEREEEIMILQSCLMELSHSEQEIISLKFGAEMTNRQISKMLSLSESNVGIIIYRAVRKLRNGFKVRQND